MDKERISYYSHLLVALIGSGVILYFFAKYIFSLALPFLIAWFVAFSIRPLAYRLSKATRIPPKVMSASLTIAFVLAGLAVFIATVFYASSEIWNFASSLLEGNKLYSILEKIMNPLGGVFEEDELLMELEIKIADAAKNALSKVLSTILTYVTNFASSVPRVLLFVLITVVSSVYFALDLDTINKFVRRTLPKKVSIALVSFKDKFLSALVKYLRAYLILMLITFAVMLTGFLILGVDYAVLLAFVVALLDALPLIGVGAVLIPWGIYQMFFGSLGLGIGLIVLYLISIISRQFIEPKIVGKNLGIHPVVSLILLYVSYCAFGILGLLLVPVFTVIVNAITRSASTDKSDSTEVDESVKGEADSSEPLE